MKASRSRNPFTLNGLVRGALAFAAATVPLATAGWASAAGNIAVTVMTDNDIDDSVCTLREAIIALNTASSYHGCINPGNVGDTIAIPAGTVSLTSSLPVITGSGSIAGSGYSRTILSVGQFGRVGPIRVSSSSLTVRDVAIEQFDLGALVVEAGASLTLRSSRVSVSGEPTSVGGCIRNRGSLMTLDVQLEQCLGYSGGALSNSGTASLNRTTVLKSTSEHGTISNYGELNLNNSTLAANYSVREAGGIFNAISGTLGIWSSTIAYNRVRDKSTEAHGIMNLGVARTSGSIIYSVGTGKDCVGGLMSGGFNATGTNRGCLPVSATDLQTLDPRLQPLTTTEAGSFTNLPRAAGGVGRVYVPASNSVLRDLVRDVGLCQSDQRAVWRRAVFDRGGCTIGAVEVPTALLVVGNLTLSPGDVVLRDALLRLGFVTDIRKDSETGAPDAAGKTVVVISDSVGSAIVGAEFRDVSRGVVVLEPELLDDMQLTNATGYGSVSGSQVNLGYSAFASTLGFFGGNITVTTASTSLGWGTPTSNDWSLGASPVASNRSHVFAYPTFAPLVTGSARGMRVGFFGTSAALPLLNASGIRLLEESILLAAFHV